MNMNAEFLSLQAFACRLRSLGEVDAALDQLKRENPNLESAAALMFAARIMGTEYVD